MNCVCHWERGGITRYRPVFPSAAQETAAARLLQWWPGAVQAPGCPLTIAGVVVELRVGLDVHRGADPDLRHTAFQLRVDGQVSVLIDAVEPLLDDQLARVPHKGHLSLAGELAPWKARSSFTLPSGKPPLCLP